METNEGCKTRLSQGDDRVGTRKRPTHPDCGCESSPKRCTTVVLEGILTVFESKEHIRRELGQLTCRVVSHSNFSWFEAYSLTNELMRFNLEYTLLVQGPVLLHEHSFLLRRTGELTQFTFSATSAQECAKWVQAIKNAIGAQSKIIPTTKVEEKKVELPMEPLVRRSGFVYSIPPKITHIILIRHGHYVNAHASQVSDADQVLSPIGRQQAELSGAYLEQLYQRSPVRNQVTSLYHSDLTRAVETAALISKHFPSSSAPIESKLLREGWPGPPFAKDQTPPTLLQPRTEVEQEMDREDAQRMDAAYNKYFGEQSDGDAGSFRVIVCHANLIRYLVCRALRINVNGVWGHLEINHCGITRIDIYRNRPLKVMALNETGHLPHSLITSSEDHL